MYIIKIIYKQTFWSNLKNVKVFIIVTKLHFLTDVNDCIIKNNCQSFSCTLMIIFKYFFSCTMRADVISTSLFSLKQPMGGFPNYRPMAAPLQIHFSFCCDKIVQLSRSLQDNQSNVVLCILWRLAHYHRTAHELERN